MGVRIGIVAPAYNEEDGLKEFCHQLTEVMKDAKIDDYELLIVDDGSQDGTLEQIKILAKRYPRLKYISFSRNFGQQSALRAGMQHSTGDAIITLDADLQHPPRLIPELIERWKDGYDIVYTRRHSGKETGSFKRLSSTWFYRVLNRLSGLSIDEGAADFRLMDRRVIDVIKELPESNLFLRGFISWCGFKIYAIDYQPDRRFAGTTKYSVRKMLGLAIQGVTQFSIKPLRLASILGVISATSGLVYGVYVIWAFFSSQTVVPGWTSVVASILVMGGIQLIILGIIGEYLGRTFMQTKQRPDYIIKERG